MSQLYVMLPGSSQPTLLELDDVVAKIKSGALPRTANAVRPGESDWKPVADLPEVSAKLEASQPDAPAPLSPLAATRVSNAPNPFEAPPPTTGAPLPPPSPPPKPAPEGAAAASAPTGGARNASKPLDKLAPLIDKAKNLPKPALMGIGAGTGVFFLLLIFWAVYRNSYSRGLTLDHLPEGCAYMTYVDVQGIATSDPVKQYLEKMIKNGKSLSDDELERSSKKEKERVERALDALKNNGIEATTIREVAMCVPTIDDDDKPKAARAEEKGLLLIGGTFRKGDVLKGIEQAVESLTNNEDICHIEDDDGLSMLKCTPNFGFGKKEPIYGALLESRVLGISPDRKLLKSLRTAKNRAKAYGADKGEHFVFDQNRDVPDWDGGSNHASLKINDKDTVLTIETHYDEKKGKDKLAALKDADEVAKKKEKSFQKAAEQCFEKSPFDMLSDAVASAKVDVLEDGIRYQYKVANKDLGKAIKLLADADKDDLGKFVRIPTCVAMAVSGLGG